MRKLVAALQISVDGFIEGPSGEIDWIESWEDPFDLLQQIDTCVLGGRMYPGYEQYWGTILADPHSVLPFSGRKPSPGEVDYAQFAARANHIVVSKTLNRVAWKNTQIVHDIDVIRELKQQPGKNIHAVGGATLVSSLLNFNLIDELRLVVLPVVLGGGKALFKDVTARHALRLIDARPLKSGMTRLIYSV